MDDFLPANLMMDDETRLRLNQINREFYARTASEFDATRGRAWVGWRRLLEIIEPPVASVIDIGCGNGRFGLFLARHQAETFVYHGIDNNRHLLDLARKRLRKQPGLTLRLLEQDVVLTGMPAMSAQLVALFGIAHHVPGFLQRQQLLASAAERVQPGGYLVFAAWRFYEEERFRNRVVPWPSDIAVERNDFLLDWRRGERALRYCHYVDDEEHQSLIAATGLSVVEDYRADGASGQLNRYAVMRKNERSEASPAPLTD